MKWFFTKILAGIALGIGFMISMVVIGYSYQKYIEFTLIEETATTGSPEMGVIENVPEDYDSEKENILYERGDDYRNGYGVNKNNKEALKWFLEAANLGHLSAQEELGYMYKEGFGTDQNYEQSFFWFTKSAEQGSPYAHSNIGRFYLKGYFVDIDYKKSYEHYLIAAEGGRGYAMGQLGRMHQKGLYVERSNVLAREWYEKGKAAGDDLSMRKIRDGW